MFSIVIPLYNKSAYIEKALNSILEQKYKKFHVNIINDGSTDNSLEVVKKWIDVLDVALSEKFSVVSQKNKGVSAARNLGVKLAVSEYIAFLDADDYWTENHLYELSRLINSFNKEVDVFSNAVSQYYDNKLHYPKLYGFEKYFGIVDFFKLPKLSNGFINSSSVCIKKSVLILNLFPENMENYEDTLTWAKNTGVKGFAFSSNRTCTYVIDASKASRHPELNDFNKFKEVLFSLSVDNIVLNNYFRYFYKKEIMMARLNMSYISFFKESSKHLLKKDMFFYPLVAMFVPKFILSFIRSRRKKSN